MHAFVWHALRQLTSFVHCEFEEHAFSSVEQARLPHSSQVSVAEFGSLLVVGVVEQYPLPYKREVAVWGTPHMPGGTFKIEYKV